MVRTEDQDLDFMFKYVENIDNTETSNLSAVRIKERLIYAVDGLKLACGMELKSFNEDDLKLDNELKNPINEVGPWFSSLISYKKRAQNLLMYERKQIAYLADTIVELITIIEELHVKNEELRNHIEVMEENKDEPKLEKVKVDNDDISVFKRTLISFFKRHDLSQQTPSRRVLMRKQMVKKFVNDDNKKQEIFDAIWQEYVDSKLKESDSSGNQANETENTRQ